MLLKHQVAPRQAHAALKLVTRAISRAPGTGIQDATLVTLEGALLCEAMGLRRKFAYFVRQARRSPSVASYPRTQLPNGNRNRNLAFSELLCATIDPRPSHPRVMPVG